MEWEPNTGQILNKETNMKLYEFTVMIRAKSESDALQAMAKATECIALDLDVTLEQRSNHPVIFLMPSIKQIDATASHT